MSKLVCTSTSTSAEKKLQLSPRHPDVLNTGDKALKHFFFFWTGPLQKASIAHCSQAGYHTVGIVGRFLRQTKSRPGPFFSLPVSHFQGCQALVI